MGDVDETEKKLDGNGQRDTVEVRPSTSLVQQLRFSMNTNDRNGRASRYSSQRVEIHITSEIP